MHNENFSQGIVEIDMEQMDIKDQLSISMYKMKFKTDFTACDRIHLNCNIHIITKCICSFQIKFKGLPSKS